MKPIVKLAIVFALSFITIILALAIPNEELPAGGWFMHLIVSKGAAVFFGWLTYKAEKQWNTLG